MFDERERKVTRMSPLHCKLNPKHGEGLQKTRCHERAGIDALETEFSYEFENNTLLCGISAGYEHYRLWVIRARARDVLNAGLVKGLENEAMGRESGELLGPRRVAADE